MSRLKRSQRKRRTDVVGGTASFYEHRHLVLVAKTG